MDHPKILAAFPNRQLASPLVHLLHEEGVSVRVHADDMGGLDPALAFAGGASVLVDESEFDQAKALLDEYTDVEEN